MAAHPEMTTSTRRIDWRGTLAASTPGVAFDMLPGALLALDASGHIIAATPGAARLFGRTAEDLRDRALHQLLPTLNLVELDTDGGETTARHRGGSALEVRWEACPHDPTTGLQVIALHDLADTRALERELARARSHVTRLLREFERFAYVASNDLQEPLRMVVSFTELLARRYRDRLDAQGQEFLHFAHDGARRMRTLLNALFEYSKLGAEPVLLQTVDLAHVQRETLRVLGLALKDAGANIVTGALPTVTGNRAHLRTLFYQLLSNAIRFRAVEQPLRIEVSASRTESAWRLCFADNGNGIPTEYRARVLAMFQRLPRDRRSPGAGMGLALCRKICELQGGSIEIETNGDVGTRLVVTWPDAPH